MNKEVDDFLAHYGVLGMKWGRRKGSVTTSSSTTHPSHPDFVRKREVSGQAVNPGMRTLSNKDIREAIERMRLEQEYAKLSQKEKVKGMDVAKQILAVGQMAQQAYTLYNSPMVKAMKSAIQAKLSE